ncbi:hypothetical protein, partial [Salmonella enterica]|uniref:hypothetical protein n=1 Tax=Salmonella enterica TaxID=28901 RepID=UPI00398C7D24
YGFPAKAEPLRCRSVAGSGMVTGTGKVLILINHGVNEKQAPLQCLLWCWIVAGFSLYGAAYSA